LGRDAGAGHAPPLPPPPLHRPLAAPTHTHTPARSCRPCRAAFTPLDPDAPPALTARLLRRAAPVAVLYDGEGPPPAGVAAPEGPPAFSLQALVAAGAAASAAGATPAAGAAGHGTGAASATAAAAAPEPEVAYVLFTSGSTGEPLGVMGTTGGLLNRTAWMQRASPLAAAGPARSVVAVGTATAFVDHVWEVFAPLLVGANAVVLPAGWQLRPAAAAGALAACGVTHLVRLAAVRWPKLA
jgi:non-ribosomal peptide synthetase component F